MGKKILYVAVADARGHLMKSLLVKEMMEEEGVDVDIFTTSKEGQQFIKKFGHNCEILERSYLNKYDDFQNLDIEETRKEIMSYLLNPKRFANHVLELSFLLKDYDLAVNDSFNASMLAATMFYPKMVNVYVKNILRSLHKELNDHPILKTAFNIAHRRAMMNVETTIKPINGIITKKNRMILNPLIGMPRPIKKENKLAVIYLNPLFRDERLALTITNFLNEKGYNIHAVGEGVNDKLPGWHAHDSRLCDKIAAADLVVSAPGMGVLSQVMSYRKKYIAIYSQQPEQQRNLRQLINSANIQVLDVEAGEKTWRPQLKQSFKFLKKLPDSDIEPQEVALYHKKQWKKVFLELLKKSDVL